MAGLRRINLKLPMFKPLARAGHSITDGQGSSQGLLRCGILTRCAKSFGCSHVSDLRVHPFWLRALM
jgi:hypothetical protein